MMLLGLAFAPSIFAGRETPRGMHPSAERRLQRPAGAGCPST